MPSARVAAPLLLALVVAIYAPVVGHEFVEYDDYQHVVDNPMLVDPLSPASIAAAFEPYHTNWIPLTFLSLQIDRVIWGEGARGHLVGNAALHWLTAFLLFAALTRATSAPGRSFFVAALFAVHPLHVESVAWVSERKDALSGLCFALVLLGWTRYSERPTAARYAAVAALFIAGLMSKPMLVTTPCLLLLFDVWPLGRAPTLRRLGALAVEKLPLLAVTAGFSVLTWIVQADSGATWVVPPSIANRLANTVDGSAWYVVKSFWPSGLAVFYPYDDAIPLARVVSSAALIGAVSAAALAVFRRAPYVLIGWLWFLGMLIPVSGIVQVGMQARADRYTYLPQIGLALAIVWGAADLAARRAAVARALPIAGVVAVLALAIVAGRQVRTWSDTRTLFEHAIEVTAPNFVAENALARLAILDGDQAEAERRYRRSIAARPDWSETHLQLGRILEQQGRNSAAARHYGLAARLDEGNAEASGLLGNLWARLGRTEDAARAFAEATQRDPHDAAHAANLALARLKLGEFEAALAAANDALATDPSQLLAAQVHTIALTLNPDRSLRDPLRAIEIAERAISGLSAEREATPSLLSALAQAYAQVDRHADAVRSAERGLEVAVRQGDEAMKRELTSRLRFYRTQLELDRTAREASPAESAAPSDAAGLP